MPFHVVHVGAKVLGHGRASGDSSERGRVVSANLEEEGFPSKTVLKRSQGLSLGLQAPSGVCVCVCGEVSVKSVHKSRRKGQAGWHTGRAREARAEACDQASVR